MRERVIAFFVCTRDFLVCFSRARIRFIALFAGGGALVIGACAFCIGVVPLFFSRTAPLLRGNARSLRVACSIATSFGVLDGAGFAAGGGGVAGCLATWAGGGSGGAAAFSTVGSVAVTFSWVEALSCTRRMLSLTLRPRYSTMAGCQSGWPLRNCSRRLPAKRYLVRAALNWFSCSSFSPCCDVMYAFRNVPLGSSD